MPAGPLHLASGQLFDEATVQIEDLEIDPRRSPETVPNRGLASEGIR